MGYNLCKECVNKYIEMRKKEITYGIIPKDVYKFEEICLFLSRKYILPNYTKTFSDPIGILDGMNGYKFGFSYHLLSQNNIKSFWYWNISCLPFRLNDIKQLWKRYFNKNMINGKKQKQKLNTLNLEKINQYRI